MAKAPKPGYVNGITTPKGRIVYPHIVDTNEGGEFPSHKYEVQFFFEKDTTMTVDGKTVNAGEYLESKALQAAQQCYPDLKLEDIDISLRDGDDKKSAMFDGCLVMSPKTKNQPDVYDGMRNKVGPEEVSHGCFGRLSVTAGFYKMAMDKREVAIFEKAGEFILWDDGDAYRPGVTFYLNRIQVTAPNDGSIAVSAGQGGAYDFPEDDEDL